MRSNDALLLDMLLAARKIVRFLDRLTEAEFQGNDLVQSAVLREFQVLGEAARVIGEEARTQYPDIPWHLIAGMRNRLVHAYFDVRLEVVWDTAHEDIPAIITQLERILGSNS